MTVADEKRLLSSGLSLEVLGVLFCFVLPATCYKMFESPVNSDLTTRVFNRHRVNSKDCFTVSVAPFV